MISTDTAHVFVCVNKRTKGRCCTMYNSEFAYEYLRGEFNRKRHLFKSTKRVKVVKTSCLGLCAFGPNLYISPDNIWYTFNSIIDIDEIINSHFIEGQKVNRLLNTGVNHEPIYKAIQN